MTDDQDQNGQTRSDAERVVAARLGEAHGARDRLRRRQRLWSWSRLLTFAFAATAWYPLSESPGWAAMATGLGIALFAWSVRGDHRTSTRRELAEGLVQVIEESARRVGGHVVLMRSHTRPPDAAQAAARLEPVLVAGPAWPLTGQECDDLDFYAAPVGAFGLLNRASSAPGARRLRDWMEHPSISCEHILARQAAVRWLDEHAEQRWRMMAAAIGLRGKDERTDAFSIALCGAEVLPWSGAGRLMRIWSVITAAFALFALVQWWEFGQVRWLKLSLWLALFNGVAFQRVRRMVAARLAPWRETATAAQAVQRAAVQAAADLPAESDLGRLRVCFAALTPKTALARLRRRLAWVDTGGPMHAILNHVFFYDLHVASAILNCVVPQREALLRGVAALADLEALLSLASFSAEQPVCCYPALATEPVLQIRAGHHPLIEPARAVPNDVALTKDERVWIVTGSNMAGKSTFLRMVGLNQLLAQWGTTPTAEAMTFVPLRLITDLQVRDDLGAGESYFLSEVRHLRRMVCPPAGAVPLLGLMDEPFRGTNSVEKVAASAAVVRYVMLTDGLFVVATHEQPLTELAADGGPAANYHFREDLDAQGMVFDYRLRPGPAPTRNALRVLEREGYPPAVLEAARQHMKQTSHDDPGRA